MPNSTELGYIRGADSNLRARDFVSAGLARALVNNLSHEGDEYGRPAARAVTRSGSTKALRLHRTPTAGAWSRVLWAPVRIVQAPAGKALPVVYRVRGYRSGGSGNIDWYMRLVDVAASESATVIVSTVSHTTTGTTPTVMSGSVVVDAARLTSWSAYRPSSTDGEGVVRLARFEVWARPAAASATGVIASASVRQVFG